VDAFDADVLIYAAVPDHPLGRRVRALFSPAPPSSAPLSSAPPGRGAKPTGRAGIGSVLLLPEVLSKPLRDGHPEAVSALSALLARLDLRPVDQATAELATVLAARYSLRAADAVHLATAVAMGAKRFITNNKRDFPAGITEVDITYPDALPEPDAMGRIPGATTG
jgi:predicted nucleic acid-binding protein